MGDAVTKALSVHRRDSHTYVAKVGHDHSFGHFVHGGFAVTLMVHTVLEHLATTLGRKAKQHLTSIHTEFLRPAVEGELQIKIQDSKVGKVYSTFHVNLNQNGKVAFAAYINAVDAPADKGATFDTEYALHPPPPAFDPAELDKGPDSTWYSYRVPPDAPRIHPLSHWRFAFQRNSPLPHRIADKWVAPSDPNGRITTYMLPLITDLYLRMFHNFVPNDRFNRARMLYRAERKTADGYIRKEDLAADPPLYWTPTHLMSLEIVQQLPDEGVEWLLVRGEAKTIRNGRLPAEMTVLNLKGEIIATGRITDFIVPIEKRFPGPTKSQNQIAKI